MILAVVLIALYLLFHKPAPVEQVSSSISYGAPTVGTQSVAPSAPLTPTVSSGVIQDGSVSTVEMVAVDPVTLQPAPVAGTFSGGSARASSTGQIQPEFWGGIV